VRTSFEASPLTVEVWGREVRFDIERDIRQFGPGGAMGLAVPIAELPNTTLPLRSINVLSPGGGCKHGRTAVRKRVGGATDERRE
jgi:hypothetical protein